MSPRAKKSKEQSKAPSKKLSNFELTPPFIEALACMTIFAVIGFPADCMRVAITKFKISFLFTFGQDRYLFEAAALPKEATARQAVKDWRTAVALWQTLPQTERNQMLAMSKALERAPYFLEVLAKHGHLPVMGLDGSSNREFKEACPFCRVSMRFIYRPLMSVIKHPYPKCSQFLKGGARAVMDELNRRGHLKLLGFIGEIPSSEVKPS